jgi:hypothetical protein
MRALDRALKNVVESNWKTASEQLSMEMLERWMVGDTFFLVEA